MYTTVCDGRSVPGRGCGWWMALIEQSSSYLLGSLFVVR
jgi:hypothetical protein